MSAARRRVLSAAAVVGMAGGGIAGWAVDNGTTPATAAATQLSGQQSHPDAVQRLDARVTALLAQERALHRALDRAKAELHRKAVNGEATLAALRGRIAAAQALLSREEAAAAVASAAAAATEARSSDVEVDTRESDDGHAFDDDGDGADHHGGEDDD